MRALPTEAGRVAYLLRVPSRTAWQALAQHPLGFLASAWPWRALVYLLSGVVFGAIALVTLLTMAVAGLVSLVVVVGAGLLLAVALSGIVVTRIERRRLRLVDLSTRHRIRTGLLTVPGRGGGWRPGCGSPRPGGSWGSPLCR